MAGPEDIPDGKYPFADRRFSIDQLTLTRPPRELTELLEAEIARNRIMVPTEELLEIHLVSENLATASFAVQRGEDGALLVLIPLSLMRKPG